jgi:probable AcnD-accessory protein PrpF
MSQVRIPATYMRGGTSKGVFFRLDDLPHAAQTPGLVRDQLMLRVVGSPDPYGQQIDGMGSGTSSTSKVALISKSARAEHDVDYLFGQVAIDKPLVDWSGNCGNLSAAVGPFAIHAGFVDSVPARGVCTVRIWQATIGKTILAQVPITDGRVQETGDFELDGVTFPAAEVPLEFCDPGADGAMFPTGNVIDELDVPELGIIHATLINSGIPTVFVDAASIGCTGTELQKDVNSNAVLLSTFERIRACGALKMGLINTIDQAATRPHTPKLAFVAPSTTYVTSSGLRVDRSSIDLSVRALSMGKLHHAMMGTCAVAIASAAAVPGTLVHRAVGAGDRTTIVFGHPSGTLRVGAQAELRDGEWRVTKAIMSRSARVLMEGWIRIPTDAMKQM